MPRSEQVKDAAVRYAAAVSSADKTGILACFAAEAEVIDPYPSPAHVGLEAISGFWGVVFSLGTPKSFTIEEIAVAGDSAVILFSLVVAVDGQLFGVRGFDVIRVNDDDKIEALTAYWDPGALAPIAGN
jgi:steroid delta-isomerase